MKRPNSQNIWIGYGYVRNILHQTCLLGNFLHSQNLPIRKDIWRTQLKKFSMGKDITGTYCVIFFFWCVYLGHVTSLPASICCSEKAWYFCKLAIKNNWQFSYRARIQYRVSDQLQLITVIGWFQKIFIHIHGRLPYFNPTSDIPKCSSPILLKPSGIPCFTPYDFPWKRLYSYIFPEVLLEDFQSNKCLHGLKLWLTPSHAFMTKCLATETSSSSLTILWLVCD